MVFRNLDGEGGEGVVPHVVPTVEQELLGARRVRGVRGVRGALRT